MTMQKVKKLMPLSGLSEDQRKKWMKEGEQSCQQQKPQ